MIISITFMITTNIITSTLGLESGVLEALPEDGEERLGRPNSPARGAERQRLSITISISTVVRSISIVSLIIIITITCSSISIIINISSIFTISALRRCYNDNGSTKDNDNLSADDNDNGSNKDTSILMIMINGTGTATRSWTRSSLDGILGATAGSDRY